MDSPDRRRPHRRAGGWLRQHNKIFLLGVVALLLLVVGFQLLYPRERTLPFATIGDEAVGYQKNADVLARLQKSFIDSNVTLRVSTENEVTMSLRELGAVPDTEQMAESLTKYTWQQRLVPFSIVFLRPELTGMDVYFSRPQLNTSSAALAKKLSRSPTDARLAIKEGKLLVTPATDGYTVDPDEVARQLSTAQLNLATTYLTVEAKPQPAAVSDADIAPVRAKAEAMIARQITIMESGGRQFIPGRATLASWVVLKDRPDQSIALSVDKAAVAAYVKTINAALSVPSSAMTVKLLDGRETSRTMGKVGQAIVMQPLVDEITRAISEEYADRELTVKYAPVLPQVVYSRQYTSSQAGLQAYVQYVTSTEDIHISLAQLDGNYWTANGRATESIPSASTYKLYVAMMLFDKIDKGQIGWSDTMLDTDVKSCLEQMIVLSLNECAERFIADFGRSSIDGFLHARGLSPATTFTSQGAIRTSSADLLVALKGLEYGTLYTGQNRDIMLDKMGRQVYRSGVPAGSSGDVQDKVGFLWGYLHDGAIVHTSKGTYALAILTNNTSWTRIAEITKELERIMYP